MHQKYCSHFPGWQTAALVGERASQGPIKGGTIGQGQKSVKWAVGLSRLRGNQRKTVFSLLVR